jgi:hypothetical protein
MFQIMQLHMLGQKWIGKHVKGDNNDIVRADMKKNMTILVKEVFYHPIFELNICCIEFLSRVFAPFCVYEIKVEVSINFQCIYIRLKMVVRPKHVANKKIVV